MTKAWGTKSFLCGVAFAFLALSVAVHGQSPSDEILEKLQKRIEALEKKLMEQEAKNSQLEEKIDALTRPPVTQKQGQAQAEGQPGAPAQAAAQAAKAPAQAYPVSSTSRVQLYGYLRLDAAYETSATYPGDYMLWVKSYPSTGERNPEFHETANQSRFGLNFTLPDSGDVRTRGKVEIDFCGGGSENKPNPMMRHAYMAFEWPTYQFELLAGQTSDVVSPLTPPTLYYSVAWFQGNIGYRHPQIRLTKIVPLGDQSAWNFQFALVRPMGHELVERRTGPDSAHPDLQGRIAYSFSGCGGQAATVGLSGHWGQETYRARTAEEHTTWIASSSVDLDWTFPLGKHVLLTGEAYAGRDLDAFYGGSDQAVNFEKGMGTASSGGWLALTLRSSPDWTWNLGAGADDPRNSDLNEGARSRNRIAFANMMYAFTKSALFGFEVSYMDTQYLGKQNAHAVRGQLAIQYSF